MTRVLTVSMCQKPVSLHRYQRQRIMTNSNYWIEHYVSYSSARNYGVHQVTIDYEIEVSDSVDFNPSIDVYVARGDKMSIQVPKSTKYHKVKRIQATDFLQYFLTRLSTSWITLKHLAENTISIRRTMPNTMSLKPSLRHHISILHFALIMALICSIAE